MNRSWKVVMVLVVLVLALVLSSCAQATPTPTPTQTVKPTATPTPPPTTSATLKEGVIKVGLTTALSGAAAGYGVPLDQAMRLVFDKFNKDGGVVIGDTHYTISAVTYDDSYTTDKTVANARKLIYDDKVSFLFLLGGTSLQAVMPLIMENKIVTFGYSTMEFSVNLTPPHPQRYAFITANGPYDPEQIHVWVAKNHPEAKRLGIIARDDVVGKWMVSTATEVTAKVGIQIVASESYVSSATDFTPQLRKILAANPDYIDTSASTPGVIGLIVKQARELGYKGAFYDSSVGDLAVSAAIAGESNFIGFVQSGAAPSQGIPAEWVDWVSQYVAKYGLPFNTATVGRSNGPTALIAALRGAKTLDTEKLMGWLETNHFQTLYGDTYFWGAKQYGLKHIITCPYTIVEYVGGGQTKLVGWTTPHPDE